MNRSRPLFVFDTDLLNPLNLFRLVHPDLKPTNALAFAGLLKKA